MEVKWKRWKGLGSSTEVFSDSGSENEMSELLTILLLPFVLSHFKKNVQAVYMRPRGMKTGDVPKTKTENISDNDTKDVPENKTSDVPENKTQDVSENKKREYS